MAKPSEILGWPGTLTAEEDRFGVWDHRPARQLGDARVTTSVTPSVDKPRRQPVRWLIRRTFQLAPGLGPWMQKGLIRTAYQVIGLRMRRNDDPFMNYGYAPLDDSEPDVNLTGFEIPNPMSAYLYHRVASGADLRDKDVLEVGCGLGGGSAFLMHSCDPRSVVGLDFAGRSIARCRERYHLPGLTFRQGDAENLPFSAGSFDAVVNVESSHCYPDAPRFFSEVARVLRPGGSFLIADLRPAADLAAMRGQLQAAGLVIAEEEMITANVVHALERDGTRREQFVASRVPHVLQKTVLEFMGARGSQIYEDLKSHRVEYVRFVLKKPGSEQAATK